MRRSSAVLGPAVASVCALATLAGCAVGPDYRAPAESMPAAYAETAESRPSTFTPSEADLSRWWRQFSDPTLEDLIGRALAADLDLQAAASRVREARAQEIIAGAKGLPSLSATASAVTYNSNKPSPPPGEAAASPLPGHLNLYYAGFDASWEIDLFGGVRRSVEEARATTAADLWAKRDAEVSLTAEVANDYLTLRALQARIALGEAELARQRGLFGLIEARRTAGFVTNLDVNQQSTVVATAAAQIPQLRAQAEARVHAIAVLLAEPPETVDRELDDHAGVLPGAPPSLPLGLPSDLLERRPDVREAERRLAASNAEIGVQTAMLYPKIDLMGVAGFAGMTPASLFSRQNLSSVALGMVSQPIFEGGRIRASIGAARERNQQAALAYRSMVLGALKDVEDGLALFKADADRRTSLAQSVAAARGSLAIAQDQYRTGFVTFINVLQAENAVLNAEDQLTQADAASATDIVAIYKALGGGWSA